MLNNPTNPEEIYQIFQQKYSQYAPDFELKIKAEKVAKLNQLSQDQNALILKHNYMTWDLQSDEVLGIRGDSLELSRKTAETNADIILFLGVKFMAETAKTLNPNKTVLIPSLKSGCSLASSISGDKLRKLKSYFPGIPVVAYVNTDADTKSEVDVCCASGNAQKVVEWTMKEWSTDTIIFVPDKYLSQNIAKNMGADIYFPNLTSNKKAIQDTLIQKRRKNTPLFIGWDGSCEVHEKFTPKDIKDLRRGYPGVYILAHPECPPEVIDRVDFAGSTGEMIKKVSEPELKEKQVAFLTECAMAEMLASTHSNVLQVCSIQKRCPHMALNDLDSAIAALENMEHEIIIPEALRLKAEIPIRRMIAIK